ncbi:unnamed protein product [Brassica napus]|uniref:(rape) hypothetical protein n=1 Tax=Brassica napus TaxID=3708 RepID=A0A816I5C2_BRANA|nr:unnamed protein product [Brassica napus]
MKQLDMLSQFVQLLYQEIVFRSSDFTRLRQTRTRVTAQVLGFTGASGQVLVWKCVLNEKESNGMEVCSELLKPMVLASYLTVTEICFLIPRRQQRVSSYQNLKMQLLMENDI